MAFTATQLATLEAAIASGVLSVRYADKTITYQSLAEMRALRDQMVEEINRTPSSARCTYAVFGRD